MNSTPRALRPGDQCRLDGYVTVEDDIAWVTPVPVAEPQSVRHVVVAVGDAMDRQSYDPGIRYTITGYFDGSVVRATDLRPAQCQERIAGPPPHLCETRATSDLTERRWSISDDVVISVGQWRYPSAAARSYVRHVHLLRWTSEAVRVLASRYDLAVTVMLGHIDDDFLAPRPRTHAARTDGTLRELEPGDTALACGYLVIEAGAAFLCEHWSANPEDGVMLTTSAAQLRGAAYLPAPAGADPRIDRYLAYVVAGTWDGARLADEGQLHVAGGQDFTTASGCDVVPRYRGVPRPASELPDLRVLMGRAGDPFVWHLAG